MEEENCFSSLAMNHQNADEPQPQELNETSCHDDNSINLSIRDSMDMVKVDDELECGEVDTRMHSTCIPACIPITDEPKLLSTTLKHEPENVNASMPPANYTLVPAKPIIRNPNGTVGANGEAESTQAAELLCLFAQVTEYDPPGKKRSAGELDPSGITFTTSKLLKTESEASHLTNLVSSALTGANLYFDDYGHDAGGQYKCDIPGCSYSARKATTLAAHRTRSHGKRSYPCSECGEIFALSDTRNKHIKRKHSQEKSFPCHGCTKCFFTKQELENHFKSRHMCIQKLKCSYCDLMFTTTRTLNVHQKKQHGHKEFQCDSCRISFAYRYELNNHRCRKLKEIIPNPLITSTLSQIPIHTFPTALQQNIQQNITPLQLLPL